MKVMQVAYSAPPDPVAAADLSVMALCRHLPADGWEPVLAAWGREPARGLQDGIPIRRFSGCRPAGGRPFPAPYGKESDRAAAAFFELLDEERPDLVHLHLFHGRLSVRMVEGIKRRRLPVVWTYRTPAASCPRGTLLYRGGAPCDGRIEVRRCTRCVLQGTTRWGIGPWLFPWRRFRAWARTVRLRASFLRVAAGADRLLAPSEWVAQLLRVNGVPPGKIVAAPYALTQKVRPPSAGAKEDVSASAEGAGREPVRVVWMGRTSPVKGLNLLLRVLLAMPDLPVRLDCYGVSGLSRDGEARWWSRLCEWAGHDSRIRFMPPVPPDQVIETLRNYDLLAVPSRWMETGPRMVLEAFAAGIPVIGSNLGGIAERVRHRQDGLLVDPFDVAAWRVMLRRVALDRPFLERLKAGVRPPRGMAEAARETAALYRELIGARS